MRERKGKPEYCRLTVDNGHRMLYAGSKLAALKEGRSMFKPVNRQNRRNNVQEAIQ